MKLGKKIDGYYNYTAKADYNESNFGTTSEYKFFDDKLNEMLLTLFLFMVHLV